MAGEMKNMDNNFVELGSDLWFYGMFNAVNFIQESAQYLNFVNIANLCLTGIGDHGNIDLLAA